MRTKALSKQKYNRIKQDYEYRFQDDLASEIKEHTRAINHIQELKKKNSTTQTEKNAISKVIDLLNNVIITKRTLIKEKKEEDFKKHEREEKALKEANIFLNKKQFSDKQKLVLWGKSGSPKSFWGINHYKDIEEHYAINVSYYLSRKILQGLKVEDAFEELNSKKPSISYQQFIDEAIAKFLNNKN